MRLLRVLAVVVLTALSIPQGANAQKPEVLRLSITNSLLDSLFKNLAPNFEKATGIKIEYIDNENKRSHYTTLAIANFEDVVKGDADAALSAASYEEWVKISGEAQIKPPADMTQRVVGRDLLTVHAHQDSKIKQLNDDQLALVFSGGVKKWKDVGGADLPIVLLHAKEKVVVRLIFRKKILRSKDFGGTQRELASIGDERKELSQTPGGISYDLGDVEIPNAVKVKTSAVGRPVTLITRGRPTDKIEKLITFIRGTITQ